MELDKDIARQIIRLNAEQGSGFNCERPLSYIDRRMDVEAWLRNEFIKKGGRPKRLFEIYIELQVWDEIVLH